MSLAAKFAAQFTKSARLKGQDYQSRSKVKIAEGNANRVEALVKGTLWYDVLITWDGGRLIASCSCPYFDEQNVACKHIWATILAADAYQLLNEAVHSSSDKLVIDLDSVDNLTDDDIDLQDDETRSRMSDPTLSLTPSSSDSLLTLKRHQLAGRPNWKHQLAVLHDSVQTRSRPEGPEWPERREINYLVDIPSSNQHHRLILDVTYRDMKKGGGWGKSKPLRISWTHIGRLRDPRDRAIMSLIAGAREEYSWGGYGGYSGYGYVTLPSRCQLTREMLHIILPMMCETGRCRARLTLQEQEDYQPLQWDSGEVWKFHVNIGSDLSKKEYVVSGVLRRGGESKDVRSAMLLQDGLMFGSDLVVSEIDENGALPWLDLLRSQGWISIPFSQADEMLVELFRSVQLSTVELPPELAVQEFRTAPRPRLRVRAPGEVSWGHQALSVELSFIYDDIVIPENENFSVYIPETRALLVRDEVAEKEARARIFELGVRKASKSAYGAPSTLELPRTKLPRLVRALVVDGWQIEADGKLYRQPGTINVAVSSGIDWFELHGTVDFGEGVKATFPQLLAAVKRGNNSVQLGDGTFGLLPEEWLKKYGMLAGLGQAADDHLRFKKSQAGLLDALLAAQPEASCDEVFERTRAEMHRFEGVDPIDPPASFIGTLRGYQREGLGWFHFLERFGFGGCLADDMGLGKTVQVLALLEERRTDAVAKSSPVVKTTEVQPALRGAIPKKIAKEKKGASPNGNGHRASLVVVPKSLIFNWKEEASKFTPALRVLNHTGIERKKGIDHLGEYDLVLTTYGTLRRDAAVLTNAEFDYVILDEAQAVKNAQTESAKAVRLLHGRHRLALSGTPIENHLGELWSLFEFLNPGMLGAASVFQMTGNIARTPDEQTRTLLSRALRPFILRRTKAEVAKDLPPKLEQTIYCEMEAPQRKLYEELREHYRNALLGRIEVEGINKMKIQILEALLRLRQAACHPGLIAKDRVSEPSAKLDVLLPQLIEVLEEGHKALVFSQFTSMLSIVRERLDSLKIPYAYLDGKTRDRASKVRYFQEDPDCKLFLISLKAGGLGLNLTAAEYVFLLDPWWNPAVEAQAIDRAHRIGQAQRVFAYRLITRDTVEEKVLELQQSKRDLADAIINADNSMIRNLGRKELELLLS